MDASGTYARLILIAAAASLAACLQTPMPIPPGVDLDANADAALDAPGLDVYDDAGHEPVPDAAHDAADEPVPDLPPDTDIGDVTGDIEDDAQDDAEDDIEDDAQDDAEEADGTDAT